MSKKHDARFQVKIWPDHVKALKDMQRDMSKESGFRVSLNTVANMIFARYFASKQRQP